MWNLHVGRQTHPVGGIVFRGPRQGVTGWVPCVWVWPMAWVCCVSPKQRGEGREVNDLDHEFWSQTAGVHTPACHLTHTLAFPRLSLRASLIGSLCPTLCDSIGCSPPGSSVHGILQARILEWVAMPSPRRSSQPQGSNPCFFCLLHQQADSLPTVPSGKPVPQFPHR